MKELIIWAYSECRSMMGLYREIRAQAPFPVLIAPYHHPSFKGYCTVRTSTDFQATEFEDVPLFPIGENWALGKKLLNDHPHAYHVFAVYQNAPNFRRLMGEVHLRGGHYSILSESPCNMSIGIKRFFKEQIYFKYILPKSVERCIHEADFFINLSGDCSTAARKIGWSDEKIIPWGYFSPPIPTSNLVKRLSNKNFLILSTGIMSPHRAPDVLLNALRLLSKWHLPYRAVMTQTGPLFTHIKQIAEREKLPISFPGCVSLSELCHLYETCHILVGSGRCEPWGMRLNDALQCGAPLAVSRGMGGVKLIDDYACGMSFNNEDHVELAHHLKRLIEDRAFYSSLAENAFHAASLISPQRKAQEFLRILLKIVSLRKDA